MRCLDLDAKARPSGMDEIIGEMEDAKESMAQWTSMALLCSVATRAESGKTSPSIVSRSARMIIEFFLDRHRWRANNAGTRSADALRKLSFGPFHS